jgi:hypothetical protein
MRGVAPFVLPPHYAADNLHPAMALLGELGPDQRDSPRESRRSQEVSRQLTYAHSGHCRSALRLTSE